MPHQHGAEDLLPEEPTPEDYGFPAKPNAAQVRCWTNQELWQTLSSSLVAWALPVRLLAFLCLPLNTGVPWTLTDSKDGKLIRDKAFMGKVEAEINRRAIDGVDHPVIYKGQITDSYRDPGVAIC